MVGVGVRADEQAHVLDAQSGLVQGSLELRERAGLAEAGVDEHHSVAGGDRVGVDVWHPRPGQRKAQAPEAGEDPVGASELACGGGRRGGQARDARTEQARESTAVTPADDRRTADIVVMMGRRQRRRGSETASVPHAASTDYHDDEGNVLTLRDELSPGTVERLRGRESSAAASRDDIEVRRLELLFERLAVRWEIAGLPLESQAELLGRYRMADPGLRRWVGQTVTEHARRQLPELGL